MGCSMTAMDTKNLITASIALLGLIVSMIAFYLTQIRLAKLAAVIGPSIQFFYTADGEFRFFLPATFTNSGPQSGVVFKSAVILSRADNPEQNYYLEWHQFHLFDRSKGRWDFDDMASPLAIGAKSAERRYILFRWPSASQALILKEGLYTLCFMVWTSDDEGSSIKVERQFTVNGSVVERLDGYRDAREPKHVEVVLNRTTDPTRIMTRDEVQRLMEQG
jgi:hypothetical protein